MEGKEKVALDASVVVKWFSKEELSDLALEVKERHVNGSITILSPDLLVYEVSNALIFNPDFDRDDVKRAVRDIFDMDLDLIAPDEMVLARAIELSLDRDLTIYDSYYMSISEIMGVELYTADGKVLENKEDLDLVKSLENFPERFR